MHNSYHQTHPELPPLTESGWTKEEDGNVLCPVHCLVPPAPRAILELIKCGCFLFTRIGYYVHHFVHAQIFALIGIS